MNQAAEYALILLALGLALFLAVALLSPLEALAWWAGWSQRRKEPEQPVDSLLSLASETPAADYYVVYLTGIAGFSGKFLGRRELGFLERLQARLPQALVVHDVFPFSVTNNPLDGDRLLSRLWRWLQQLRLKQPHTVLRNLISARNILQVAVSADPRYGPIYNVGVAREILRSLLQKGYPLTSRPAITLVGVSGGGQVALGAARYLKEALETPVYVISVGGVLSDDPGISYVDHLYHLQGTRDRVAPLGALLYPGRWPFLGYSPWNRARKEGRITTISTGPMTHMGNDEYFSRSSRLPNGQTHSDWLAELVAGLIAGTELPQMDGPAAMVTAIG